MGAMYLPGSVGAAQFDITKIDLVAAAPYTYDHLIGGGAYDARVLGDYADVVTTLNAHPLANLQPAIFSCGDVVSFLVYIQVRDAPIDPTETISFDFRADAATPLNGPGKGFVNIAGVRVNRGVVSGGDGPGGTDSAIVDDGGSSAVLLSEFFQFAPGYTPPPGATPGPFVTGSQLIGRIQVNDLEAKDRVVVRIDAIVGCSPTLTGNGTLNSSITRFREIDPVLGNLSINTSTSNLQVPFINVGDIKGSHEPVIVVKKTVTTLGGSCPGSELITAQVGDAVKYCYEVVNTGTAHLHEVTLVDDNGTPGDTSDDFTVALSGLSAVDQDGVANDLAAGTSAIGTAVVAADFRGGSTLTNTATATGLQNEGWPMSATDTASVNVVEPPASLSLVVKASLDDVCGNADDADPLAVQAGTDVRYCYFVTNTGQQSIANITITDPGLVVPGSLTLAAGASGTLISDAFMASVSTADSATATGSTPTKSVTSNPDSAEVIVPFSDLAIVVKASLDDVCGNADDTDLATVLPGTTVYYCYQVTNVGLTTISGVTVSDALATVGGSATLPPGGSYTFVSDATVANADVTHTATALGTDAYGFSVDSDPDDASVDVVHPSLTVQKTASTDGTCPGSELVYALPGQNVTYCYTVVNNGDTTVTGVVVTDGGTTIQVGDLPPGGSASVSSVGPVLDDTSTTATASGTDGATGTPVTSGPDGAAVDVVHPALTTSVTVSTDGTCPGQEVVNVLANSGVTWCYTVTNTGDTAIGGVTVTDDDPALADPSGAVTLGVGQSYTWSVDDTAAADLTLNGSASGVALATGSPIQSAEDAAAVNVVSPNIDIDVTVSTDGTCPGVDAATVVAGSTVVYCYDVKNLGDDTLTNVVVTDGGNNTLATIGSLPPGGSFAFSSNSVVVVGDGSATGNATGTDVYGFPVSDGDTALVHAIYSDLVLQKDAPATATSSGSLAYTITVTNVGQAPAAAPVVTDTLPAGLSFVSASSASGSCSFEGGKVTCTLADLAPGASATITVNTTIGSVVGAITNVARVDSATPDADPANNTDDATTNVTAGGGVATRTIGFYATHPSVVADCLAANGGSINLGFVTLRSENFDNDVDATGPNGVIIGDKDTKKSTALDFALGILKANIAKFTNNQKRTPLEQARMQAGQQVLAAICNSSMLHTPTQFSLAGAVQTLAGTDIQAILDINNKADAYNNSGDAFPAFPSAGPANSKAAWDDPTDPND